MINELISKLEDTALFKKWSSSHPDAFLTHAFIQIKDEESTDIGYFDEKNEMMTTFMMDTDGKVIDSREDKVFREPGKSILCLNIEKVKKDLKTCLEIAANLQKEKYSVHTPVKRIVILQNLEVGQVWNITFITSSMKTLNIKIDAETGDIVEEGLHSIMEFSK